MNERDPKGFYARLGVDASASQDAIKDAYRRLAKELHPDKNSSGEATKKFQALTEAYEILSDPAARNAYDALRYTARVEGTPTAEKLEPICCSHCGKITAQPRATVFTYVVSVLLATFKNPIQGIFCLPVREKLHSRRR